jgi:sugar O-acyltransferase (sialic acid O-acetyltransferase NeuD family)
VSAGLLLVGASGLAREVIAAGVADIVGVVDDDDTRHGTQLSGVPVLGGTALAARRDEQLVLCIGPSLVRQQLARRLSRMGVADERYAIVVARTARIGSSSEIGPGTILLDGVVITADARLGHHVVVMPHCTITHDARLDDFVTMASGVSLGGGVHVRAGAYIGMNAAVRQDLTIGRGATIGMGAVVLRDVPEGETWAGVPARRMGKPHD